MTSNAAGVRRKLEAFFRREEVPGLVSAYLFGSHAEGRAHRDSDGEADHAFRRDTQLLAADLDVFLRRMSRVKLEALGGEREL